LGDAIGKDALNDGTFDLMGWIGRHGKDVTRAPLDKVIAGLKAQGITSFAANGFCFGGRSAFELTVEHELKAVIFSHPSLLAIPSALELLKANSSPIPLLFQFAVGVFYSFFVLSSTR
jgi:dienelactone hydrolase